MFSMLNDKGVPLKVVDGCTFVMDKKTQSGQRWKCSANSCNAYILTDLSGAIHLMSRLDHNHPDLYAEVLSRCLMDAAQPVQSPSPEGIPVRSTDGDTEKNSEDEAKRSSKSECQGKKRKYSSGSNVTEENNEEVKHSEEMLGQVPGNSTFNNKSTMEALDDQEVPKNFKRSHNGLPDSSSKEQAIEDEFDRFGKSVALQLRSLPPDRAKKCIKKMQDILNKESS